MRVSDETIEKILKQGGVVDEPQLADLKVIAERSKQTLQETAIEQKAISEEDLTKLISDYIGGQYAPGFSSKHRPKYLSVQF